MYLTVREVAQQLRVNPASIYALVETGKLAHHRIGARRGAIRISEADLATYLESCHRCSAEERCAPQPPVRVRLKHIRL